MNEKEWAEFFELTQGRKPETIDYLEAELAGEFIPDKKEAETTTASPQQVDQVQTTPPAVQADGSIGSSVPNQAAVAAPKPKKFANFFKAKKEGEKGWPLWLNIGIAAFIALILLIFGISGYYAQKNLLAKDIKGDWQLTKSAYYDDGNWETFSKNGEVVDSKYKSDYEDVTLYTYLTSKNGNLVSYNHTDLSDYDFYFASTAHPSLTLNINKDEQTIKARIDDDDYKEYYPVNYDEHTDFDDLEARYFVEDHKLTIVYYDDNEPYYMETYKSLSSSNARKEKRDAKNNYMSFKEFQKELKKSYYSYYGYDYDDDDSSDSKDSGNKDFQAG
ncbi:hypothetical protein ACVR0S_00035 [Streptococcus dentapri]|uniref:DUF4178 domain-containing protein n=1 Tax=Streptococcus dentapri TaxID=573564 RepID=A0ABV8D1K0_9STRE